MNASVPLTMTVEEAALLLGIGRGTAYEAARRGELPTIRLGRRLLVPRRRLLDLIDGKKPSEMREPGSFPGSKGSRGVDDGESSAER